MARNIKGRSTMMAELEQWVLEDSWNPDDFVYDKES
jgi:hypothetical protein